MPEEVDVLLHTSGAAPLEIKAPQHNVPAGDRTILAQISRWKVTPCIMHPESVLLTVRSN